MKIVTHKFRIKEDQICYLVNLVDSTGRPLESHVAGNNREKSEISEDLAIQHNVKTVFHNSGFSIIE
tara:strand:- start:833 stop:1033 length:201 start_codon:yes stop_codon:yes gene_type:complete